MNGSQGSHLQSRVSILIIKNIPDAHAQRGCNIFFNVEAGEMLLWALDLQHKLDNLQESVKILRKPHRQD